MQVTGYTLREAIRRQQLRRDTIAAQFSDTLHVFEGEEKQSPDEIATALMKAEKAVAGLQAAQDEYNLHVKVTGKIIGEMTLCAAVKLVGGTGRLEKMWRTAAAPKQDRYGVERDIVRNKDEVRARSAMNVRDLTDRAAKAASYAGALRAAIAEANSTKIDIEGLDGGLFE
jgi:hypothetical protein